LTNAISKKIFTLIALLFISTICKAQNGNFPKASFAGKWERVQRFNNLVLEIKFEKDEDNATVIDIGTGEAPSIIFKASVKENKLVILPIHHQNDFYIEMEVIKGKLHFRQTLIIWDENGNFKIMENGLKTEKIYKRMRKSKV